MIIARHLENHSLWKHLYVERNWATEGKKQPPTSGNKKRAVNWGSSHIKKPSFEKRVNGWVGKDFLEKRMQGPWTSFNCEEKHSRGTCLWGGRSLFGGANEREQTTSLNKENKRKGTKWWQRM